MDIATAAIAFTVLENRSVRAAARALGRPVSSVGDAFERFEQWLALPLATRNRDGFTLTLAGEGLLPSIPAFVEPLAAMAQLSGERPGGRSGDVLHWAAGKPVSQIILSHFLSVAHHQSIRRAAGTLAVSQPALTRQMARLEALLGLSLLTRGREGCTPTTAGDALQRQASLLLERFSALSGQADKRFSEGLRTVKLGTIIPFGHESRLAARLAQLVADWRQESDGQQHLLLSSMPAEDLLAGLLSGALDLALTDMAISDRRFESRLLFSSELVLVGGASSMPEGSGIQTLAGRDLVVPSLRSGLRQKISIVLDGLRDALETPPGLVEVDTLSIVMALVLSHGFVTILPLDAIRTMADGIRMMRLPASPSLSFHLVWLKSQTARRHAERVGTILTRSPPA